MSFLFRKMFYFLCAPRPSEGLLFWLNFHFLSKTAFRVGYRVVYHATHPCMGKKRASAPVRCRRTYHGTWDMVQVQTGKPCVVNRAALTWARHSLHSAPSLAIETTTGSSPCTLDTQCDACHPQVARVSCTCH